MYVPPKKMGFGRYLRPPSKELYMRTKYWKVWISSKVVCNHLFQVVTPGALLLCSILRRLLVYQVGIVGFLNINPFGQTLVGYLAVLTGEINNLNSVAQFVFVALCNGKKMFFYIRAVFSQGLFTYIPTFN